MTNRLKQLVADSGLSQAEVAVAVGMTEAKLSRLLNGRRRVTVEEAESILRILREKSGRRRGLTMNDLVDERGAA